jgi:hypothetical protein
MLKPVLSDTVSVIYKATGKLVECSIHTAVFLKSDVIVFLKDGLSYHKLYSNSPIQQILLVFYPKISEVKSCLEYATLRRRSLLCTV